MNHLAGDVLLKMLHVEDMVALFRMSFFGAAHG